MGRNKRSVWTVATHPFSKAHFATFPPKLIEPCILAGTSEKGCCPECGKPWERVVEKTPNPKGLKNGGHREPGRNRGLTERTSEPHISKHGTAGPAVTTGWQPICQCSCIPAGTVRHDPIPATVLDPFFGAGTTGLVAKRLGRDFLGIELNPEYAAMARDRINGEFPLWPVVIKNGG